MQQQLIRLFYEDNCKKPIYVWDQTGGLHSIQRCDSHSTANVQGMHSNIG